MKKQISDKNVLITGVNSGIGREIAVLLAAHGARVFGTVRNLGSAQPVEGVELTTMNVDSDDEVADGIASDLSSKTWTGKAEFLVNV